jgi:hypothetical protein
MVDPELRILSHQLPPAGIHLVDRILQLNCVPGGGSGVVASTELVRAVGGFDPDLSNLADWDLWIRLALAAPVTSLPHPLVAYRVQATGMVHGVTRNELELAVIDAKYAHERAQRGVQIAWGSWYRYFARLHLRLGHPWTAALNYVRAARSGEWSRYVAALLCLIAPHPAAWADRRTRDKVPDAWVVQADAWLAALRSEPLGRTVAATDRPEDIEPSCYATNRPIPCTSRYHALRHRDRWSCARPAPPRA